MKKLFCAALALVMFVAVITLPVLADDENTATPEPPVTDTTPSTTGTEIARFQIDNANIYDGMERAYKDGYIPSVADGTVTLVLPLIVRGKIQGDKITVTPNLGDANSSPIQYKNYQKTFSLADNPVNVTGKENEAIQTVSSYLVRFDFPLRSDRQNGTYPITLEIQANDGNGDLVTETYICYVSITDGKSTDTGSETQTSAYVSATEPPVSNPRILVSKYEVSSAPVLAGEDFSVSITLLNTSDTEDVQNMLVTVSSDNANFVLKNDTSTIFLGDLKAGETTELELNYGTDLETPAQRYNVNLSMEFDDVKATSMSSSGSVTVEVAQPVNVELSPFNMPSEVNAGETIQMSFQVMNLGRSNIYNVRVELDVPGLSPSGSAFIGNMESGTSATETLNVFAGMKEDDERYGHTSGVVRLIYEDVSGQEYVDEVNTYTNVKELVIAVQATTEEQAELEQARAVQWWVFVAAGAAVIVVLVLIIGTRKRNRNSYRHIKA